MKVWRITRQHHAPTAADAYNGEGSALRGGRWNSRGVRVAYASASRALALVELLAHIDWNDLSDDLVIVAATLAHQPAPLPQLPAGWEANPPSLASMQIGDTFVREAKDGAMIVPSAVVPGEYNVLINPGHPHFHEIIFDVIEPFRIDRRLAP